VDTVLCVVVRRLLGAGRCCPPMVSLSAVYGVDDLPVWVATPSPWNRQHECRQFGTASCTRVALVFLAVMDGGGGSARRSRSRHPSLHRRQP